MRAVKIVQKGTKLMTHGIIILCYKSVKRLMISFGCFKFDEI